MGGDFAERFTLGIKRWRYLVLAFWGVCLVVGAVFGLRLLGAVTIQFSPPHGTDASKADTAMKAAFPVMAESSNLVIYVEPNNGSAVLRPSFESLCLTMQRRVGNYSETHPGFVLAYQSYYTLKAQFMPSFIYDTLVTPSENAAIIGITMAANGESTPAQDFARYVNDNLNDLKDHHDDLYIQLTGQTWILMNVLKTLEHDMAFMDGIVLPLAICVMAYIIRSPRLLTIAPIILITVALTSFSIMYGVALHLNVYSATPSLMMSMMIAMSIDYSLFMLSRYREALVDSRGDHESSVIQMMRSAGHTITVSGSTLCFCFLGLVFLPLTNIRTLGVGCFVTLALVLLGNLTIVPAIMFTFPHFYARSLTPFQCCGLFKRCASDKRRGPNGGCFCCKTYTMYRVPFAVRAGEEAGEEDGEEDGGGDGGVRGDKVDEKTSLLDSTKARAPSGGNEKSLNSLVADSIGVPVGVSGKDGGGKDAGSEFTAWTESSRAHSTSSVGKKTFRSWWYRLGLVSQRMPWGPLIVLAMTALAAPLAYKAITQKTTDGFSLGMARHAKSTDAFLRLGDTFGLGWIIPYRLLIQPQDEMDVYSAGFFNESRAMLTRVVDQVDHLPIGAVQSAMLASGVVVHYWEVEACELTPSLQICKLLNSFLSNDTNSAWALMLPTNNPIGADGQVWLNHIRDVLEAEEDRTGFKLSLQGVGADTLDSKMTLERLFPTMVAIVSSVISVLVAIAFKSIVVPLRSVYSIALTILMVYGLATLVFENGALKWTHIDAFDSAGGVQWLVPIVNFTFIIGITLDYDVFLLVRIVESRMSGTSTRLAVSEGLAHSGRIITAAGFIMAVAFSGMMLSSIPVLEQFGFFLCIAVLIDTFIVRSLLVPATMGLLGEVNWWPRKLPKVVMDVKP